MQLTARSAECAELARRLSAAEADRAAAVAERESVGEEMRGHAEQVRGGLIDG